MLENAVQVYPRKGGGGGRTGSSSSSAKGGKGGSSTAPKLSPAASKGAPKTFTSSRFANPFSLGTSSSKGKSKSAVTSATTYSDGGGKSAALTSGLFSGRLSGGGARNTVYGTRTYGSGYPYGGYGYYVSGRPFPYVFIPVPIHRNYYGCDEYYDNVNDTDRPGGALVSALVQPAYNTSSVTYRLVGDDASVSSVLAALVANCSVANNTGSILSFSPSSSSSSSANESTWPQPEQVIQWYRASSFALALDGYNNTAALPANQPASNASAGLAARMGDAPLPAGLNMTFLGCVNSTIGESVPLADPSSSSSGTLSTGAVVGLVVAGVATACVAVFLGVVCVNKCKARRRRRRNQQWLEEQNDILDEPEDVSFKPPFTQSRKASVFDRISKVPFARSMGYKPVVEMEKSDDIYGEK